MTESGKKMKKETKARYEIAATRGKNNDKGKFIETKELNIGDGWSLRVERFNGKSGAIRLRT